jgi:hypothetical protein
MNRKVWSYGFSLLVLLGLSITVTAQDVELPLTWKGEGKAMVMMEEELETIAFEAVINIDTDGWVTGKFSNEEGDAKIERFYYSDPVDGVRNVVIVVLDRNADESLLVLLQGKVLKGQLMYGEVLLKKFEPEGAIEKGLNLGDKSATAIFPDYMPEGLKNALKTCKKVGCFAVTGGYAK